MSREKALEWLGFNPQKHYILVAGRSIGAGKIVEAIHILHGYLQGHRDTVLSVVCGSNQKLYEQVRSQYKDEPQILLRKNTECMAKYLKACDFYISKPGGISSTETAVANVALIHISPILGCETKNERFFSEHGMSIGVSDLKKELLQAIQRLADEKVVKRMKDAQHQMIDALAAEKIAEFVEECV